MHPGMSQTWDRVNVEAIMTTIQRFVDDESGATAIEYGLIAGLVCVAIIAALNNLGTAYNTIFTKISTTYATAAAK